MRRGQQFFEVCEGSHIGSALRPDSKGIGKSIRMFEVKSIKERRQPFFGQNSSMGHILLNIKWLPEMTKASDMMEAL
jgi:hypothetical protein